MPAKIRHILDWQRGEYSKNPCDLLVRTKEKEKKNKRKEPAAKKEKTHPYWCVAWKKRGVQSLLQSAFN